MSADPLPEFTAGMVEGEARVRIQCNFCGVIDEIHVLVPEHLRDQIAELIKQDPDNMLDAAREMATIAAGWWRANLRDGGVLDICADCLEKGDWRKL